MPFKGWFTKQLIRISSQAVRCVPTTAYMLWLVIGGLHSLPAWASLGLYEHGAGIQSQAMGGITYGAAFETTTISFNPANLMAFAPRYDIGVDILVPRAQAEVVDNAAMSDSRSRADEHLFLPVPQGGISRQWGDKTRLGLTLLSAGLGPEYDDSPYQRFGGARKASLQLSSSGLTAAVAHQINERHVIGSAVNLSYQSLQVEGIQFLSGLSASPQHVSDNGKDSVFGIGFSLGWRGQFNDKLTLGAGYRSKSWTQKHRQYRGLIPDSGRLELPAIWGLGWAYQITPRWLLAGDYQRYEFASEVAFGNRIGQLSKGNALGSEDGPGFGHKDLTVFKLGLQWQVTPATRLKAGYIDSNQMMSSKETLFGFLGPVSTTTHYTIGLTTLMNGYEISGSYSYAPAGRIKGRNSIPAALGGGEANLTYRGATLGLSLGRTF